MSGYPARWLYPLACLVLYPVPVASATLSGHYSKPTFTAISPFICLFLTRPWFSEGLLHTDSASLQPVPPSATSLYLFYITGCSLPAGNTHQTPWVVPQNHPLLCWNWTREHPGLLLPLEGGKDSQHSPVALSLMTTVSLIVRCLSATVKAAGYVYGQRGVKSATSPVTAFQNKVYI